MNAITSIPDSELLVVRRLHVDLQKPFDRHWNGGDAFRTAFANALSMSFPLGEQFFIDAIKRALPLLRAVPNSERLVENAKAFIGQEATHRFIHTQFNQQLIYQGYRNRWEIRASQRIEKLNREIATRDQKNTHLHELAVTCAIEHLTAIMGDTVMALRDSPQDWFFEADESIRTMWHWHCAEEAEHKSLAFDVYLALGGSRKLRMYYFRRALFYFIVDLILQMMDNLWRDGSWKRWRTWKLATRFLLGRHGLLRTTVPQILAYGQQKFHPTMLGETELSKMWLHQNQAMWTAAKRVE